MPRFALVEPSIGRTTVIAPPFRPRGGRAPRNARVDPRGIQDSDDGALGRLVDGCGLVAALAAR